MIDILGKIPTSVTIACSGGIDSMVILDFLRCGKKNINVAHFDHGTDHAPHAREFVRSYCDENNIPLVIGEIEREKCLDESPEEYWRNERLRFLHSLDGEVVTAHHLDDVVEWYLFTSFHGYSRYTPYRNENIIRPFLTTPKSEFVSWAERKSVSYVIDPSNNHERYARNRIRHSIMPEVLKINPGIRTVLKKKVRLEYESYIQSTWRPAC